MKSSAVILFFILLVMCFNLNSQEKILISTGEWPPYTTAKEKNGGFINQIIKESFAEMGILTDFHFIAWNRAKALTKNGDFLACSVWARSDEIEDFFYFSDPIYTGPLVFFHLKTTKFNWTTYEDLINYKIGMTLGNTYGVKFQEYVKKNRFKVLPNYSEKLNFEVLIDGKIDIFPINRDAGLKILKNNFPQKEIERLTFNNTPIRISKYCLIFPKNEQGLKFEKLFNKGFKKLIKKGRYQEILNEANKHNF